MESPAPVTLSAASVILSAAPVILSPHGEGSPTSSLITYLSRLLDETLIGDVHLVRFSEGLEQGQIINPISEVEASDFRLAVQRSGLEYLIHSGGFDPDMLLSWVREKLSERGVVRQQRDAVHQDTEIPIQPMEFVPIPSGKFMIGAKDTQKEVIIKEPYEMSVFQITQWQYAMVMESNPSKFKDGAGSVEIEINEKRIRMQPNHPVEQVSLEDARKFIAKLNELSRKDDPRS